MPDAGEREVNLRLRRVDWRFLLPWLRPSRVFCRAGPTLARAVASIAGEMVTEGGTGDCDLAVAEDPDRSTLAELYAAVRPGGVSYTEWHLPAGRFEPAARAIREAGFTDVAWYRPWPDVTAPVYWIPLGTQGAERYLRDRRRLRGGRVRRLLAAARRWPGDLLRGRPATPICAVALRPDAGPSPERVPAAWLRDEWPRFGLGPTPGRLATMLVTGGARSVNKVVLLAFAEPSPAPLVALKAPRVGPAAAGVLRERDALAALARHRHAPLPGVPRVLTYREVDGLPVLGETALAGRPLDGVLSARNLDAWSTKVTDWLVALAREAPVLAATRWRETIVEPALRRFGEQFAGIADPGLVRDSERIARAIAPLPCVPEQRDLGPWNVLVTPAGGLAVLDWESAEVEGLPALDLLYYLAYAAFGVERAHDPASRAASYRRLLDASTPTGAVRRRCLARYCAATALGEATLPALRVLLWLIHARSEYRRAVEDAGGSPDRGALQGSLFLALWELEVRDVVAGGG
jgi:hypothetical protein